MDGRQPNRLRTWGLVFAGLVGCTPNGASETASKIDPCVTVPGASSATAAACSSVVGSTMAPVVSGVASVAATVSDSKTCPLGMVLVEGGLFRMGAPHAVNPDHDYYLHDVALRSFCLDKHEMTVAEYRACVDKGGCVPSHSNGVSCTWDKLDRHAHPINCVDYGQSKQACASLGKRLPTEEEWEYAARGGSETRTYSWGEEAPSRHLSCYDHRETCPVDAHPAGAFGLLGMTGNVWEWTSSPFVKYAGWIPPGEWYVYRGGSYSRRFPKWMKTWVRNRNRPSEWGAHLGFRCAADLADTRCPSTSTPAASDSTRCLLPGEKLPKGPVAVETPAVDNAPPPVFSRSPAFDADCQRFKPTTPLAYQIRGSSFAQRQQAKQHRGCSNRDVGADFNSVCCPN